MEDQKIIELYFARNEQAIMETEQKYGSYCLSIANAILGNREDSRETVNDTWLRTWNAIPPQKPVTLKLFLAKITRNLAFNTYRSKAAQKRGGGEMELVLEELGDSVSSPVDVGDALDARELARAIQKFLETQPRRERGIFLGRYFQVEDCAVIADRYGLTEANVRKILTRTRQKLKDHLRREGYDL